MEDKNVIIHAYRTTFTEHKPRQQEKHIIWLVKRKRMIQYFFSRLSTNHIKQIDMTTKEVNTSRKGGRGTQISSRRVQTSRE